MLRTRWILPLRRREHFRRTDRLQEDKMSSAYFGSSGKEPVRYAGYFVVAGGVLASGPAWTRSGTLGGGSDGGGELDTVVTVVQRQS